MTKGRRHFAFLLTFFIILSLGFIVGKPLQQSPKPKLSEWSGNFTEGWRQFEQLTKEQKFEAASTLVEKMLASAGSAQNSAEWTRCLIRYTQLRISLHGYETAVRFLKISPGRTI